MRFALVFTYEFFVWYFIMWLLFIPFGWYLLEYTSIGIEEIDIYTIIIPYSLILASFISPRLRGFFAYHFGFMSRLIDSILNHQETRAFNRLRDKGYVRLKRT